MGTPEEWWNLLSAVIGGILGALAGGIPAWLIARRQSADTLDREREVRLEGERAAAFRVCVKLLSIINGIIGLHVHVQRCVQLQLLPENRHMAPWQLLIPMIGFTDEGSIRFTPEEVAVFIAANEREFMMDLMLLAQRHASSTSSFLEYCRRREAFLAIAPKPERFSGAMGTVLLTHDEIDALKPLTIPLDQIVVQLSSSLIADVELARGVVTRFGPIAQAYFNDPTFVSLTFPSYEEIAEKIGQPIAR